MADPSSVNGNSLAKKNKRKKKRKNGTKADGGSPDLPLEPVDKYPKQTSDHQEESVITTTKCSRCGKSVRQLVRAVKLSESTSSFVCDDCIKLLPPGKDTSTSVRGPGGGSDSGYSKSGQSSSGGLKESLCNCAACISKRENAVPPEVERDAHITQSYWMEIRHIVRCIYRDNMSITESDTRKSVGSDKMRAIVRRLCSRDPHQFFQRLETLAREYLLEVKVRLLEQLSCGFNSPQLAIEFIQMLLDEYSSLCSSLPALLYLLEPLEETDYVRRLGVTIELVNKNLFRELIFAESFMSSNLPLIIAQLRLSSLSADPFHRSTADTLGQRYVTLDQEMEEIGLVWKNAKEQLVTQQQEMKKREDRRAHIEKIRADGESFKKLKQGQQHHQQQVKEQQSEGDKDSSSSSGASGDSSSSRSSSSEQAVSSKSSATSASNKTSLTTPPSSSLSPAPTPADAVTTQRGGKEMVDISVAAAAAPKDRTKENVAEWSKILFKCIKPVGDPEFRIKDDIATHTITLRIDMTSVDLKHADALCTREQVEKYEKLGMRREEITEVSLKLNAIKHLGINLRIDDLFDERGFMIVDGHTAHEEKEEPVYFVDDGKKGSVTAKEKLIQAEMSRSALIDLTKEKDLVVHREARNGEGRETDLLQSMTMKIRFMKKVTSDEMRGHLESDSESVMFDSCDQVQMKLTQLELNTMRLVNPRTTNDGVLVANSIKELTGNRTTTPPQGEKSGYVHATESHRPFVDLLLEQGKHAERMAEKEKEKEKAEKNHKPKKKVMWADQISTEIKDGGDKDSSTSAAAAVPTHSLTLTGSSLTAQSMSVSNSKSSSSSSSTLCIPSSSLSCQCFACVGAVAAQQTAGKSRPLNPVDPAGSKLSIDRTLVAELGSGGKLLKPPLEDELDDTDKRKGDMVSDVHSSSKHRMLSSSSGKNSGASLTHKTENLWQNWMSTNDIQLDEEAQAPSPTSSSPKLLPPRLPATERASTITVSESPPPKPTSTSTSSTTAPASSVTTTTTTSSSVHVSTETCCDHGGSAHGHHHHHHHHHHHDVTKVPSCTATCECHHELGSNRALSAPGMASASTQTSGANGDAPVKRYCPCCYCELFGHNNPPTVPTSHNYTKQRDKMRQKLEKKKKTKDSERHHHSQHTCSDDRSLDDLLNFIEGKAPTASSPVDTATTTSSSSAPLSANNTAKTTKKKKKTKKLGESGSSIDEPQSQDPSPLPEQQSNSTHQQQRQQQPSKEPVSVSPPSSPGLTRGTSKKTTVAARKEESSGRRTPLSPPPSPVSPSLTERPGRASPTSVRSQRVLHPVQPAKHSLANTKVAGARVSRETKPSVNHAQTNGRPKVMSSGHSSSKSESEDDYDQELEAFKKLCFSSAPVEKKKKILLNMEDIKSKIK